MMTTSLPMDNSAKIDLSQPTLLVNSGSVLVKMSPLSHQQLEYHPYIDYSTTSGELLQVIHLCMLISQKDHLAAIILYESKCDRIKRHFKIISKEK